MIAKDEADDMVVDEMETIANGIFVDLTDDPPTGTPIDTRTASNGWQQDMSDPRHPEIYNKENYIGRLNRGHSKQSPAGFIDTIVDKWTQ